MLALLFCSIQGATNGALEVKVNVVVTQGRAGHSERKAKNPGIDARTEDKMEASGMREWVVVSRHESDDQISCLGLSDLRKVRLKSM